MNSFLTDYSAVWSLVESLVVLPTILITFFLFFRDPIKRWSFFGYLPTAVLVIFDPDTQQVLLIRQKGTLGFPQGGIFSPDVVNTVEQTLRRELGLHTSEVDIRYAMPLSTIAIDDKYRTRRITMGSISLVRNVKGKGYVAYFISTNLTKLKRKIKLGYGITDPQVVSIKKAISVLETEKAKNSKNSLLVKSLYELEAYLKLKTHKSV